jgi:hypothetical protein
MKLKITENQVKAAITQLLNHYTPYVFMWRQNNQGTWNRKRNSYFFTGMAGVPDLIGFTCRGRFLGIEVKRPGGKQSEMQKIFEKNCLAFGGIYILADDIDKVVPWLEKIKKGEI